MYGKICFTIKVKWYKCIPDKGSTCDWSASNFLQIFANINYDNNCKKKANSTYNLKYDKQLKLFVLKCSLVWQNTNTLKGEYFYCDIFMKKLWLKYVPLDSSNCRSHLLLKIWSRMVLIPRCLVLSILFSEISKVSFKKRLNHVFHSSTGFFLEVWKRYIKFNISLKPLYYRQLNNNDKNNITDSDMFIK